MTGALPLATKPVRLRCALYTRKSSEEGLDQAFNSLHAQREACEAYILSQAGEGWRALPTAYDDGGFSGGSMERPALRQLLADIVTGRVDVVVVYKIDRLTRSLADFARIVELFDTHKVSFVSVTQAVNTTTSMGRLTLNVLLSFAQFEREVTGERIRDKIAASKKKGMWMGGTLPLGYDRPTDAATRAFVVNDAEAATVRLMFTTYLELGSVHVLQRSLVERKIRSKAYVTKTGKACGDLPFSRGALFYLLRNPVYRGIMVHKTSVMPGIHPAVIEADLFERVQASLDANARRHQARPNRVVSAALTGRIFDADGVAMSPTFSHGARGQVYRYYVSASLQQGKRSMSEHTPDALRRVPAVALEQALTSTVERLLPGRTGVLALVARIEIYRDTVQMLLPIALLPGLRPRLGAGEQATGDEADPAKLRLTLSIRIKRRSGRASIVGGSPGTQAALRDPTLIRALRAAHALVSSEAGQPQMTAAPPKAYARRLIRLAFLAPELQAAIIAGHQPVGTTVEQLVGSPLPLLWRHQIEADRVRA